MRIGILASVTLAALAVGFSGGTALQAQTPAGVTAQYCFTDGGMATYFSDGSYAYSQGGNVTFRGTWQGSPGSGIVSVNLGSGMRRDTYFVDSDGQLKLKTKVGTIYGVRPC